MFSILGGTYSSREREISSNNVKRADDCLQADFPGLIRTVPNGTRGLTIGCDCSVVVRAPTRKWPDGVRRRTRSARGPEPKAQEALGQTP
jgi:hypothetical protein